MRTLLLIFAVACSSAAPNPPSNTGRADPRPASASPYGPRPSLDGDLMALCYEDAARRVVPCSDDVQLALLTVTLGRPPEDTVHFATEREALIAHQTHCAEYPDYVRHVVECWNEQTCPAFAACIGARQKPGN